MPTSKPQEVEAKARTGLRQKYLVTLTDGAAHEVQTELSDVLQYERQHGGSPYLEVRLSLEAQMWVIWRAGRRLQLWSDVDEPTWTERVLDFGYADDEFDEDTDQQRPTQPAPSA